MRRCFKISQENNQFSSTPYDDVFRSLLARCRNLIIPVVNEVFGEHYTGVEKVILSQNELYQDKQGGKQAETITDSHFGIEGVLRKNYHFECQSGTDSSILVRMFGYGSGIALQNAKIEGDTMTVSFPEAAVLYLRSTRNTPKRLKLRIETRGGSIEYEIPIIKLQDYSLAELFEKKLYFLLPFYLFNHEKEFPEYEADKAKLQELIAEYQEIVQKLEALMKKGEITAFTESYLMDMSNKVLQHLAVNYETIREGVGQFMSGVVLKTPTTEIWEEGLECGLEQGLERGLERGLEQGIKKMVASLRRFQIADDVIAEELMTQFSISQEEAMSYLT